jgi:hypothetical protein
VHPVTPAEALKGARIPRPTACDDARTTREPLGHTDFWRYGLIPQQVQRSTPRAWPSYFREREGDWELWRDPRLAPSRATCSGPGVEHRVLLAGHTVMVSKPRELAAIINDVVGRAQAA